VQTKRVTALGGGSACLALMRMRLLMIVYDGDYSFFEPEAVDFLFHNTRF
jgi:hypothetical protein